MLENQYDILGLSLRGSAVAMLVLVFLTALCLTVKHRFAFADVGDDLWASKMPMYETRGRLGVAVMNEKICAIGGDIAGFYGAFYGVMLSLRK